MSATDLTQLKVNKKGAIGILTGGGDVPGLNPAIRAVTFRALREGYSVIGFRRGWAGLVDMVRDKNYDAPGALKVFHTRTVRPGARDGAVIEIIAGVLPGELVVTQGTGKAAALDFTHVVGKTGTSSNYKDAWFVGFTGKYVASIWLGNDDNRPMLNVTGGHGPAPTFHSFMSVVHTSMNIPTIPGLPPHPFQIAEQQRVADQQRTEPQTAGGQGLPNDALRKSASLMPEPTREALKKISIAMQKAGSQPSAAPAAGTALTPSSAASPAAPSTGTPTTAPPPPASGRPRDDLGRRADQSPNSSIR